MNYSLDILFFKMQRFTVVNGVERVKFDQEVLGLYGDGAGEEPLTTSLSWNETQIERGNYFQSVVYFDFSA